jgi:hypothetical protein
MSDTRTMPIADVHALLRRSFAMRAAAYGHIFDVLREELGEERALALTMQATERMGRVMGQGFAALGPSDLDGLRRDFLAGIIEGDTLFAPEVKRCDGQELRIDFHRCPLKEAWVAEGRSDHDVRLLCQMAGAIDRGLFERAGFTFAGETWAPGATGCCHLVVRPGQP